MDSTSKTFGLGTFARIAQSLNKREHSNRPLRLPCTVKFSGPLPEDFPQSTATLVINVGSAQDIWFVGVDAPESNFDEAVFDQEIQTDELYDLAESGMLVLETPRNWDDEWPTQCIIRIDSTRQTKLLTYIEGGQKTRLPARTPQIPNKQSGARPLRIAQSDVTISLEANIVGPVDGPVQSSSYQESIDITCYNKWFGSGFFCDRLNFVNFHMAPAQVSQLAHSGSLTMDGIYHVGEFDDEADAGSFTITIGPQDQAQLQVWMDDRLENQP